MSWAKHLGGWTRRSSMSWLVVAGAFVGLAGLGSLAVLALRSQEHTQSVAAVTADARVIALLTAERDVAPQAITHPLTAAAVGDLGRNVGDLIQGGDLLGLAIDRTDGTVLFQQGALAPAVERDRSMVPAPRAAIVLFFTVSGVSAITVVLPVTEDADHDQGVSVAVTIPANGVTDRSDWAVRELTAALALVLLLAATGVFTAWRRFRRRHYLACHDVLTGLGNRTMFEDKATGLLGEGSTFGVIVMDLDGFRRVNDTFGHAAGDELLSEVAATLRTAVRPGDVVVRLGGDEFAVVMPGIGPAHLHGAAQRLLDAVRTQFNVRGVLVDNDASVGAAVAPSDGRTVGDLLQAADIAMYEAKHKKLGVCVYAQLDSEVDSTQLQVLVDLRTAIDNDELRLHYQPAAAIEPGMSDYVEALVRWQHPTRGLLTPDCFIPAAEDTALIHPLTAWVLNEAIRQCAAWRLDGLAVHVAVNISPRSLTRPGLVGLVIDTLARNQLAAEALEIEITESAIIARPDLAHETLDELHRRGVSIAVDDFGTGYTSLAHLKTLPIDTLKIDRGFVRDLLDQPRDETVVAAIIQLGHGLGARVVAEGVEDQQTLLRLTALGCDVIQGFHISKPLAPNAAASWLRNRPLGENHRHQAAAPGSAWGAGSRGVARDDRDREG